MELIQPYISGIAQAVVGILASLVLLGLLSLKAKLKAFIDTRTSADQRELLHKLALEAQALVEKIVTSASGVQKFNAAKVYVSQRLAEAGIQLSVTEIQATIEKAVQDFNAVAKPKDGDNP